MKTIGLIGGMSFESTLDYYKIINEEVNKTLGGLHSAKILIDSYDFAEIAEKQTQGDWEGLSKILIKSAQNLEKNGADYIAIATNTMHIMAQEVRENISVPLIHITEAAANYAKQKNFDSVALLGTRYTMTKPFYKDKLQKEYGLKVITPCEEEQSIINSIIFDELCVGIVKETSRNKLLEIITKCKNNGAKAAILGCTELPIIVKKADIELIDTTKVHCLEIVKKILE